MTFGLKASPPNVSIGGPVPSPPGFRLKHAGMTEFAPTVTYRNKLRDLPAETEVLTRGETYESRFALDKQVSSLGSLPPIPMGIRCGSCWGGITKTPCRLRGNHCGIFDPVDCERSRHLSAPRFGCRAGVYRCRLTGCPDVGGRKHRHCGDRRSGRRGCQTR